MAEIRSGKREGSVVSTQTFDTTAQNGRETWEALRRELEDIGISPEVINEKRQFIVTWFREVVAVGKLEEDASLDDNDSAMSSCKSNDLAGTSDRDNVLQQHSLSVMPEPRSNIGSEIKGSMPGSQRSVELMTPHGNKALHEAARHGHEQILLMLLRNGALIDSRTSSSGSTPLFYVATAGVARILLDKGADINITNNFGITPLIVAAKSNRKAIVQLLLKNGAIISAVDNRGRTALKWAQERQYGGIVRLLQKAEAQR